MIDGDGVVQKVVFGADEAGLRTGVVNPWDRADRELPSDGLTNGRMRNELLPSSIGYHSGRVRRRDVPRDRDLHL
jgi:hypothetical protein